MYLSYAAVPHILFTVVLLSPPDLIYHSLGVETIRIMWKIMLLLIAIESILLVVNLKFGTKSSPSKSQKFLFLTPFIIAIVIGILAGYDFMYLFR